MNEIVYVKVPGKKKRETFCDYYLLALGVQSFFREYCLQINSVTF